MNIKEERDRNTNRAWSELYQRLEQDGLLAETAKRPGRTVARSSVLKWIAGVAALLSGVVFVLTLLHRSTDTSTGQLTLVNGKGQPTLVTTFEDGSVIYLSEQASLAYPSHFAQDKREVSLNGDAFFDVSKNATRPFIVYTQTTMIEVLGTSFNVRSKDSERFSLSVRTGKVKVTSKIDQRSVYVEAGETALFKNAGLHTLPTTDLEQFDSYLQYIHFKDQTLYDIVRIINENAGEVQLKVAPELNDRRVTVTFRENTPEEMAQILCSGFNLKLHKQQNILYLNSQFD